MSKLPKSGESTEHVGVFGQYGECFRCIRFDGGQGRKGRLSRGKETLLRMTDSAGIPSHSSDRQLIEVLVCNCCKANQLERAARNRK